MKQKTIKLVCIFIFSMLIFTLCIWVFNHAQTIDEPYEYPVALGTEEWKGLVDHADMEEACRVPDKILKKMTTEALLQTAMDYPLLIDMLAFGDVDLGYEAQLKHNHALRELTARHDAEKVLRKYKAQYTETGRETMTAAELVKKHAFEMCYSKICSKV